MAKYIKRPVVVDVFQMTLERRWGNSEWPRWLHEAWNGDVGQEGSMWPNPDVPPDQRHTSASELIVGTLQGPLSLDWDDYIIHHEEGGLDLQGREVFESNYVQVEK